MQQHGERSNTGGGGSGDVDGFKAAPAWEAAGVGGTGVSQWQERRHTLKKAR